jgi:adenylate kinase family enzyme
MVSWMKRILVIGTSGSGKSSLAERLSKRLNLPFFASDHFYWEPGWKTALAEKVRQQVSEVVSREAWVLDGNFDDERDLVWKQADCIVWLDYSFMTIFRQIVLRNFRWTMTQQPTWSGNKMTLQRAISGIRHAVKSYSEKKQNYLRWLAELRSVTVYRFCTNREMEIWFQDLHQ